MIFKKHTKSKFTTISIKLAAVIILVGSRAAFTANVLNYLVRVGGQDRHELVSEESSVKTDLHVIASLTSDELEAPDTYHGRTLLMNCIRWKKSLMVINALVKQGANINAKLPNLYFREELLRTPLSVAAEHRFIHRCRYMVPLISWGADIGSLGDDYYKKDPIIIHSGLQSRKKYLNETIKPVIIGALEHSGLTIKELIDMIGQYVHGLSVEDELLLVEVSKFFKKGKSIEVEEINSNRNEDK